MKTLPAPLLPAHVDLRDFPNMQLNVARLLKSKTWLICRRRPALAFYAMNLWCRAWHELPAGSIEDDEDVLADAAGCHPSEWPAYRDDALRGWIRCSDGRLYHPTVCELAAVAFNRKLAHRYKREQDRARKAAKSGEAVVIPEKPADVAVNLPTENRKIPAEKRDFPAENSDFPPEFRSQNQKRARNSDGNGELSNGIPPEKVDLPAEFRAISEFSGGIPTENALKGRGRGIGIDNNTQPPPPSPPRARGYYSTLEAQLREAAGLQDAPHPALADLSAILGLLDAGADLEATVLPAIRRTRDEGRKGRTWGYYIPAIREAVEGRKAAAAGFAKAREEAAEAVEVRYWGSQSMPAANLERMVRDWASGRRRWDELTFGPVPTANPFLATWARERGVELPSEAPA